MQNYDNLSDLNIKNQHFLITGGTGFIGRYLCSILISKGHTVTVLTRNRANAVKYLSSDVLLVEDLEQINKHVKFDIIVNLAGERTANRWTKTARAEIIASRVKMIDALHQKIESLTYKPKRFIQASAIGCYGINPTQEFDEETSILNDGSFAQEVCRNIEFATQKISQNNIPVCNLRIGIVIEKNGGAVNDLKWLFKSNLGSYFGDGEQWWSWIHMEGCYWRDIAHYQHVVRKWKF